MPVLRLPTQTDVQERRELQEVQPQCARRGHVASPIPGPGAALYAVGHAEPEAQSLDNRGVPDISRDHRREDPIRGVPMAILIGETRFEVDMAVVGPRPGNARTKPDHRLSGERSRWQDENRRQTEESYTRVSDSLHRSTPRPELQSPATQIRFSRIRATVHQDPVQRQEAQIVQPRRTLDDFVP